MSNIKDIANMAGVSASTVSHVVNRTRYVSPELEGRVLKAIREADSPPNFVVKKYDALKEQRESRFVLLLVSDKESYFQAEVERRIKVRIAGQNFGLISFAYKDTPESLEFCLDTMLTNPGLLGVILFPNSHAAAHSVLSKICVPSVILGQSVSANNADNVFSDSLGGAYNATRHLIRNGHERIVLLGGPGTTSDPMRLTGYKKSLEAHGISYDEALVKTDLANEHAVFTAMDQMMNGSIPPTAVLVANYSVALHLFGYLNANNIQCPGELSVVCFSDFPWSRLYSPPLTVIDQDCDSIAKNALNLLSERIERPRGAGILPNRTVEVPTRLKVRSSTCGIAHGPFGEKAEKPDVLQLSSEELKTLSECRYTAAISFHYTGKAWMDLTIKGINAIFNQVGISLIAITDAHFDPELQSKQLASIRMLEPDVLIAMSTDNVRTAEAFRKVAGPTKLVLITNVPEGLTQDDYACCVSVNEHAHGRNIGTGLGEYMRRHGISCYGMLKHDANFYATNQRDQAAEQVLTEEYHELTMCGVELFKNEAGTYEAAKRLLMEHPEIRALYVPWDGPAIEAMRALTDINRADVAIATGDLDRSSALVMASGGMIKTISAQSPYEQGVASALAAAGALIGKKLPKFVAIEPISISPANLLKSWKIVFREEAPQEIRDALKQSPIYITGSD